MDNLPHNPISRIRSELQSLDGVFLRIASWFLIRNLTDFDHLSTGSLARELGTSRATIVRFCQQLGYSGFPEFKAALVGVVPVDSLSSGTPKPLPPTVEKVYSLTRASLDATISTLDVQQFDEAVRLVAQAGTIILYGVGDSAYLAGSAAHKLALAAKPSYAVSSTPSLRVHLSTIRTGDVVILVSQSGRWKNVLNTLDPFRQKGCTVIALTSQANSIMAQYADICLLTAAYDITLGDHPFTLRAAQAMVLDMLVTAVAANLGQVFLAWEDPRIALPNRKGDTEPAAR